MVLAKHGFPHQGHPSEKYSLNWEIEQAGSGWLGVGNYYGFSIVFIKKIKIDKQQTEFPRLQHAFHENIVGLVEAFCDDGHIHLAYNYHGFAVNLSQVVSTPAVKLSEPELASICRSVLLGLRYIHEQLQMSYGKIDSNIILLCPDGAVKLANIGNAMITDPQTSIQSDRESVGGLIIQLSHAQGLTNHDQSEEKKQGSGPHLSKYAMHFIQQVGSASYSYLFEHAFLQQANPDGRTWYLIHHYLDAIMYWGASP